ncbi:2-dehydropantoate 2-reductase [Paraburkholderia pallida]|uniref:2-dehydropantoate 2-reductase n=1 Tax=Paraburkholderia pallida TaxID=2547399 RepID=A0A4P7D9S1_9BURK|nr:2-dehydropantoate 2-reductase [Paraburkholderia pallida]QBR03990.1 2-dehydropantoate 2-reductase [Paraburkholderia pallida]
MHVSNRIVVHGAGSVGCYIGGCLAAAGLSVTYLGRPRIQSEVAANGMLVTDQDGRRHAFQPCEVDYRTEPETLSEATLILVTVKSEGTKAAVQEIQRYARVGVPVVSLQNGVRNAAELRAGLGDERVLAGMVPFNVVHLGPGHWHCGTSGKLEIEGSALLADYLPWFGKADLPVVEMTDVAATQWGKLLLNLNNPINALSGLPLRDELAQASYRQCFALCVEEAVQCLIAAGITPRSIGSMPPAEMIELLRLPDAEYHRVVGKHHKIDAAARSSMWEDLEHGRPTEVDYLSGEVVALAETLGRASPINARARALVREAERGGRRDWTAKELLKQFEDAVTIACQEPKAGKVVR